MSLLRRASRRHVLRHPAQLGLCVLGVALGVAVVVSIDLAIRSSRAAFRTSAEAVSGRATHVVSGAAGSLDEALLPRLRVELGIRESAPVVEGLATSPAVPGRVLRVLGVDPFSEGPFRAWAAGGAAGLDLSAFVARPGAVVLAAGMAEEAGVAPGDVLPVVVDGRPGRLPVVGVLRPGDALAREGTRDLLLLDIASAQEILRAEGTLTRIDLRLPEGPEGTRIARAIEAVLPPDGRLEPAGTRSEVMRGMIDAFDLNLTALSLLALVFGMFLIYNAMTFSVVQRRELLGGLRALGVTRGEILRGVLGEAAWIGVAGAVAGTVLGIGLGRGLVGLVTRTINDLYFVVAVDRLAVDPLVLMKGAALGVGGTLLAALPAALEAAWTTPRLARLRSVLEERSRGLVSRAAAVGAALTGVGAAVLAIPTPAVGVSFAGLFLMILGMALLTPLGMVLIVRGARPTLARAGGILGTMASRGVVTALSRTAPAVAALVVAVSVTVGLGVMIQSFRGTLGRWLESTLRADVYVSLPSTVAARAEGTLDPAIVDVLVGHRAVAGHSTYRGRELRFEDGIVRLVALDLDPRGEAGFDFLDDGGRRTFSDFRAGSAVLVSEPFSFRFGRGVGDSLTVPTPAGPRTFGVAGVYRDYGSDQGVIMMARGAYDAAFADRGVTSLGLFLVPEADPSSVAGELERVTAERGGEGAQAVVVRTNAALREGSLRIFERTFRVTAVLRLLAFAVAFVGVLSAFMALELERARELGVLRANGLTPAQVWGLVGTQTGLMGLVAGLLALPMGLVLSVVMIHVVNKRSFGWSLRMEVGPEVLLQAVGLALAGALLAGLYPAWRMARTSPAVALREE